MQTNLSAILSDAERMHLFSANGAVSLRAWGTALGFVKYRKSMSAESAIHFRRQFGSSGLVDARFQRLAPA